MFGGKQRRNLGATMGIGAYSTRLTARLRTPSTSFPASGHLVDQAILCC
jgi:hypothetical protein